MAKEKDSYWFRHDSTSGRGLRLKKLQHKYDHWGKGVYWDIIEVLREQSGYKYEADKIGLQMLSELIGVKDFKKFQAFFEDCLQLKLFKKKSGHFFSETLSKNMQKWESSKFNGSKGGRPKKQKNKNPIETQPITQPIANENHNIIGEDIIKEEIIIESVSKKPSEREIFFKDLENSVHLETTARDNKTDTKTVKGYIPLFRTKAKPAYRDYNDFVQHFRNSFAMYFKNSQNQKPAKELG